MKILILGGTAEARQLASRLMALGHEVTSSLAGRTQDPILPEGNVRSGGFGGVSGLIAFLRAEGIERLVDATHPYARTISMNALAASEASGVKLVRFMRPAWTPAAGESWIVANSAREAVAALPAGAKVLLTTGHADLETYLERSDCFFLVRVIEAPGFPLPGHATLIRSRPPYALDEEHDLMVRHGVTHLVTKNSGGSQTRAKLNAARQAGIRIVMIARPIYGPALEVDSIAAALAALDIGTP